MWSQKSQDALLSASILGHCMSLINGLAAKMPALIISPQYDDRKVSVVSAVRTLIRKHLWLDVASFFAENVNDKLPLLLERCFIRRTSYFGRSFLQYGL